MSERSLRILQAIPFFAAEFGGSVTQTQLRLARLAARGHEVSVVTTELGIDPSTPRDRWIDRDGYRVWYATAQSRLHRSPPYLAPPSARRTLAELVPKVDIVCAGVGLTLWNDTVRKIAGRAGIGYVYSAEGALCPIRLRIRRWAKAGFLSLVERRVLRGAAAVLANTEKDRADLVRVGAAQERIHVIPNGVVIADGAAGTSEDGARERFGLQRESLVVAFVGRLHAIKGIDLLLEATVRCVDADRRIELLIVGPDGGEMTRLAALGATLGLSDRLHFIGLLDAEGCQAALRAADLFALTSHTEGLPLGPLEAAAHGLPLLVTDACNIPEVDQQGAGMVVRPTIEGVTDGLRRLVDDPTLRARCGENARQMAATTFAIDVVVPQLEALLTEVVRGTR